MKLWQLRVFTGLRAMGNVTGIVLIDSPIEADAMAGYARQLGYPDTAFVRITDSGVRVDTFTPFEEVRICFQTLLATEAILRADGGLAGRAPLTADTPSGRLLVTRFDDSPELPYVLLAAGRISVRPPRAELPLAVAASDDGALVVNTGGRARAYLKMRPAELAAAAIPAADVRAYCQAEGVSGVCLTAANIPGSVELRVFTMSLNGAEDVATGGAAAGLPAFWDAAGHPLGGQPVLVRQGFGPAQTRAILHLRAQPDDGGVALGGNVAKVAVGTLL
jgi:PhzF family phenazine biosynthesis protein